MMHDVIVEWWYCMIYDVTEEWCYRMMYDVTESVGSLFTPYSTIHVTIISNY